MYPLYMFLFCLVSQCLCRPGVLHSCSHFWKDYTSFQDMFFLRSVLLNPGDKTKQVGVFCLWFWPLCFPAYQVKLPAASQMDHGNHWQILTDLFIDINSSLVSIAYLTRAYRLLVFHEHQLFRDCYTSSPSAVLQCLDPILTLRPFVSRYRGTRSCKAVF